LKISRVKHVIITSIIFLIIIGIIVFAFASTIDMMKKDVGTKYNRVIATEDIEQGKVINAGNVTLVQVEGAFSEDNMVYRLKKDDLTRNLAEETPDNETVQAIKLKEAKEEKLTDEEKILITPAEDERWVIGKVAKEKIYKGEPIIEDKIVLAEDMVTDETRLYAIPFESSNTGGYNIALNEKVDICVLYSNNYKTIAEYQNLPQNKVIDIVLAGKKIADIRDASGNSRKRQSKNSQQAVVPGYICFNLTYEEINKLEVAKRQGTLFIGNPENNYKDGTQSETFMSEAQMPSF